MTTLIKVGRGANHTRDVSTKRHTGSSKRNTDPKNLSFAILGIIFYCLALKAECSGAHLNYYTHELFIYNITVMAPFIYLFITF